MTDLKPGDVVQLASGGPKMTLSNQTEGVLESMRGLLLILLLGMVLAAPALGQQTATDWLNQGDALAKLDKYTEAIQAYDKGIGLSPQFTDLYYHKGVALNDQKRYDDAIEAFNKVNEVNPKDGVVAYYQIGRTLSTASRYDEAIQAYNKSIQAFNTYGEWWPGQKNICAQSWYYKGLALDAVGKFDEAQNAYDNAIRLNPSVTRPNKAGTGTSGGSGTRSGSSTGVGTRGGASTGVTTIGGGGTGNSSTQYCLLRKPFYPPQDNCYEFYLASTTASAARATVDGGNCVVTPLAAREGWEPDPTYPKPLSWAAGDAAMGVVSPYFGDFYGCHPGGAGNGGGAGNNASCPSGQTNCSGSCTDTSSDSNNCGSCGNVCQSGASCVSGSCSSSGECSPSETNCGGSCTDTQSDSQNCGSCGNACTQGESCVGGSCSNPQTTPGTAGQGKLVLDHFEVKATKYWTEGEGGTYTIFNETNVPSGQRQFEAENDTTWATGHLNQKLIADLAMPKQIQISDGKYSFNGGVKASASWESAGFGLSRTAELDINGKNMGTKGGIENRQVTLGNQSETTYSGEFSDSHKEITVNVDVACTTSVEEWINPSIEIDIQAIYKLQE